MASANIQILDAMSWKIKLVLNIFWFAICLYVVNSSRNVLIFFHETKWTELMTMRH